MKVALHLLNRIRRGGGENVALNYSKVLLELGIESFFIGKKDSQDYEEYIKDIVGVKEKLSLSVLRRADYIFIHSNKNLLRLFFQYFFFLNRKKKKIYYIQHLCYGRVKFRLLSFFINRVCTAFIQITPITSKHVSKCIKIPSHFIVNFYINRYDEEQHKQIRQNIRKENAIDDDKTVFIFSAVFKPGKRVGDFIQLAKHYQNNNQLVFLLLGDGPEAGIVRSYDGHNLIWAGLVNDVEKYLIASDVYVFTSQKEMMPMALIEAINTKKKIIAYDTEVNRFLLNNEICSTFNDLIHRIDSDSYPTSLKKYDKAYAIKTLEKIL